MYDIITVSAVDSFASDSMCFANFVIGLGIAMLGPALLDLAIQTASTLRDIGYVFTIRSAGYLVGTVVCGYLMKYVANTYILLAVAFVIMTIGMCASHHCVPYGGVVQQ